MGSPMGIPDWPHFLGPSPSLGPKENVMSHFYTFEIFTHVTGSCKVFISDRGFFCSVDKPAKLPDPLGPLSLSTAVPSSSIASANAEVRGVLEIEERTTIFAGKEAPTQRFLPNLRCK